jgi:hypothetical protein
MVTACDFSVVLPFYHGLLGPLIANTRKPREKPFIAFSV